MKKFLLFFATAILSVMSMSAKYDAYSYGYIWFDDDSYADGGYWSAGSSSIWENATFTVADGKITAAFEGIFKSENNVTFSFPVMNTNEQYEHLTFVSGFSQESVDDFYTLEDAAGISYPIKLLGYTFNYPEMYDDASNYDTYAGYYTNSEDFRYELCIRMWGYDDSDADYEFYEYIYCDIPQAEQSGVAAVEAPVDAEAEYFNLQGVKVANPENGMYICRKGGRTHKVIIK